MKYQALILLLCVSASFASDDDTMKRKLSEKSDSTMDRRQLSEKADDTMNRKLSSNVIAGDEDMSAPRQLFSHSSVRYVKKKAKEAAARRQEASIDAATHPPTILLL